MAPLVLEGQTLGQRHRHYNQLVAAAVADDTAELLPLNHDEPDVDNLLRIDVACRRRHLQYVLDVLQCDDMLYVSRAIKQSTWLITDDQYAHIINPQHLHDELFPKMMSKAKNKLLLAIRLNLKNESRVEDFFNYYKDDMSVAQKWLPYCSLPFIEKIITDNIKDITCDEFQRLCENQISILKIIIKLRNTTYISHFMNCSNVLINKFPEEYLEIMLTLDYYEIPFFGARPTKHIMQKCPEKIIDNFKKLNTKIHLPTFAKYLKKDKVRAFLLQQAENKEMKTWLTYDNIKHFLKYMPAANRFEFIKKLFIDREMPQSDVSINPMADGETFRSAKIGYAACHSGNICSSNATIYRWYQFASFNVAFNELKKLIRIESSPLERNAMLTILIHCARRDANQVQTLLQFYREKHINEPLKFKVQFVNTLLSTVATHRFDDKTWGILNDIFSSMELYMESEHNVPQCVKAIIVYKLLHNEEIPDIISKKYSFDTFNNYRKKLEKCEQDIIFNYVYNLEMGKLQKHNVSNEVEMTEALALLGNVLTLLKDWKKNICEYPEIIKKIGYLVKTKKENLLKNNLSSIFNIEKKWRKHMFEESLGLEPSDKTCVHALKHDPALLQRFSDDVSAMYCNDAVSLRHTLSKLRIYWTDTIAQTWIKEYLEGLNKPTGHKATVEGICFLLPRKEFISLLEKYAPVQTKIDWSNTDTTMLSLQKNIAKRMKLVRPTIHLNAALSYAKDDYLQYALPSLNAITYNMNAVQVSEYVPVLFESQVSLRKHGLRLAFARLKFSEIKDLVENMWKNTKNSSIKTVLFLETYELLKCAKKESSITELWQLLSMFIANLTPDENRKIYMALGKAEKVPLIVRPQFFVKSFIYLKSLPSKANCASIIRDLTWKSLEIIDKLEPSFIVDFLLPSVDELVSLITTKTDDPKRDISTELNILAAYLTSSEDEKTQTERYERYLVPILDGCIESWKTIKNKTHIVRLHCSDLLDYLFTSVKNCVFKKSFICLKMFQEVETKLRTALPLERNYHLLTYWSIAVIFVDSVVKYIESGDGDGEENNSIMLKGLLDNEKIDKKEKEELWEQLCTTVAPKFGKACLGFLEQDISLQLPSLAGPFYKCLRDVFDKVNFRTLDKLATYRNMLDIDVIVSYLVVLEGTHDLRWISTDESDDKNGNVKQMKNEIFYLIKSHPSEEVKIHYYETLYSDMQVFESIPYDDDSVVGLGARLE